jgi:hypothetical protein
MDHQKAEIVAYQIGIQNFRCFGLTETQKVSCFQLLFSPKQIPAAQSIFKIL